MLIIASVMLAVVLSNTLVSARYGIELKTKTLSQLTTELAEVQAQATNSMGDLRSRGSQYGMVPGREGAALFVTSGVAYTDASAPQKN